MGEGDDPALVDAVVAELAAVVEVAVQSSAG
jgi:hypothetical protein